MSQSERLYAEIFTIEGRTLDNACEIVSCIEDWWVESDPKIKAELVEALHLYLGWVYADTGVPGSAIMDRFRRWGEAEVTGDMLGRWILEVGHA